MEIEKRDVDISKLFYWNDKFIIYDSRGEEKLTFYMRIIGDAELNRSRVFALRRSSELRKALREEDSDERLAYMPDFSGMDKDAFVNLVILTSMRDYTQEAMKEVKLNYPVEPKSDASLEAHEKYQKEIDDFPEKRNKEYAKYINKKVDEIKKELNAKPIEQLKDDYIKLIINELCENEMIKKFQEMNAYFSSYKDQDLKERLFKDFDEFDNLPGEVKKQFLDCYSALELSMDELKKSPEATQ